MTDHDKAMADLLAEVAELRAWKVHILEHADRKKRPFLDRLAQAVIADQIKEIDRLHGEIAGLPIRLGEATARADAAEARVAELEAGLAFYRDGWAFKTHKSRPGLEWRPTEALLDDCGNHARTLLRKDKQT